MTFAGTVTKAQVREIAEAKMKDLNANDIDNAMLLIEGSARSMGIEVQGVGHGEDFKALQESHRRRRHRQRPMTSTKR